MKNIIAPLDGETPLLAIERVKNMTSKQMIDAMEIKDQSKRMLIQALVEKAKIEAVDEIIRINKKD